MMRTCIKCGKKKSLSKFSKNSYDKSGFRSDCKTCASKVHKEYRLTEQGKQVHRKSEKKYMQTIIGRLRHCFQNMKHRCNNPENIYYKNYGGRGIKCLFKSSNEFVDYVINKLHADARGLDIDRIDNNGNYEPGNIRFVTRKENCKNRKR